MRKKVKSHGEYLPRLTLYYDDLEKIIELLKDTSGEIEITTDDYILENLDELKEMKEDVLNTMTISCKKPSIKLDIKPKFIWFSIDKDNNESRGLYEKIKIILMKRKKIAKELVFLIIFISMILTLISFAVFVNNYHFSIGIFFAAISVILGVILSIITFPESSGFKNKIYLKYRNELPSFWKRKRDDIILSFISAFVGAIAGGIITLLIIKQ